MIKTLRLPPRLSKLSDLLITSCIAHCDSIIALHGLDAKSPRTWIAWKENDDPNSGDVHWLKDSHMLPAVMPKSRILTYDWNANYDTTASTDRFLGHADTFLDRISDEREKSVRTDRCFRPCEG